MEEYKSTDVNNIQKNRINPFENAGIFSKLFYCWAVPIFIKGFKKDLTEDDMYKTRKNHESNELGNKIEDYWKKEQIYHKNPSLWRVIFKTFGLEFAAYGIIPLFTDFGIRLLQPLVLKKFLSYYDPNQTEMTESDAYLYASLLVFSIFVNILLIHQKMFGLKQLGMKIRIACCSLVYRKALRLSKSALADTTVGQMINLLSNDVRRFEMAAMHMHDLWVAPIMTSLIVYLLYINLGITSISGIALFVLFVPIQMFLGKKTSDYRLKTALRTDHRVRLMNEIISGIQVIKMYTWEKPFVKLVELSRKLEIKQIRANTFVRAFNISFMMFMNRTAIFISILTYVLTQNRLDAQYVYVLTSFYGLLRQLLTMSLPMVVTTIAETNISVKRIRKFLLCEELHQVDNSLNANNGIATHNGSISLTYQKTQHPIQISLKNVSAKWSSNSDDNTLSNINFSAEPHQLIGVVGTVGGGKSTLLNVILKEIPVTQGILEVNGVISYASQEPWLFSGSIRQNILFGQMMNEDKYREVIKACALERDFSLFPYGDRSLVGEKGVTLSGGQKARVNLARAIYKNADIYLLDDPLSAVDTHVGKQLFDDCISGYLRNKCVVLVTHQLQYLKSVNRIYLMENGTVIANGTYSELQSFGQDFLKLLKTETEHDDDEVEIKKAKSLKSLSQSDDGDDDEDDDYLPKEVKEQRSTGSIKRKVYIQFFLSGGHWIILLLLMSLFLMSQLCASGADYFLSFWVNIEQARSEAEFKNSTEISENDTTVTNDSIFSQSFIDEFFTSEICIYIYSFLIILVVSLTISRSISFLSFCLRASIKLHNNMFSKIVKAPMRFFNTNTSGRILNRFSRDVGSIDELLPMVISDTILIGLTVISITIVIATIIPWILIPSAFIVGIFYFLKVVYLASSRNIKRMEGTTRSPVFSHLTASIQGITTIRAFGAQDILIKEFDNHQDLHSSVYYLFLGCNETFGFWLDMHCVFYTAFVILSFLISGTETFSGNVGLAITQSMGLTGMVQWGMRQWSELENQMTSVERVLEYTEIASETDDKVKEPSKCWPEHGNIEFQSVSLRYASTEPFVLKNLNFSIRPNEKIGIVGRTGAGKSSIITAIFRLSDFEGNIIIDNINTKEISLSSLRSKISIIPQEPVLFSGTLRKNLDPFDEYNDEVIWSALQGVELKAVIADMPSSLNTKMSESGSNFSVGQRQLICLARAIIRSNKILILDEATANVDPHTDELIQTTIREKFKDCTVLTVAHRLHTVMDSDKILVMDSGCAVEFNHPYLLLQNTESILYGLVQQTGKGMAENLIKIAEESYNLDQYGKKKNY